MDDIDVELSDALLIKFFKPVENLYGTSAITPNMHMCGHIKKLSYENVSLHAILCFSNIGLPILMENNMVAFMEELHQLH